MSFNDQVRLDPSQVQDRRGRRVGRTVALGGGGIGLIILVFALLMGADPNELMGLVAPDSSSDYQETTEIGDLQTACQTGADANNREDCRIVGFVNSIQAFWSDEFAANNVQYTPAQTVLFSGVTEGACGYASGASGPFYCPYDQKVYLDLSFFEELTTRFGAEGGPLAEAYVLAHEYGHHVQNLLGLLDQSNRFSSGPQSMSVFIELQADCLAGVWIYHAAETGYLIPPTSEEIAQSLNAAQSVGDDRIQRATQGYVSPESWTHGSSAQRKAALENGLQSGDINSCESSGW